MNSLENLQPSRRIIQPQGETEQCTNVVETVLLLVWHPFSTEPIFTLRLEAVFLISLKSKPAFFAKGTIIFLQVNHRFSFGKQ